MNEKEVVTETGEWRRRQSSMLSTFEEIAQTFLNSVSGERGNSKVFTYLQDYLDGSVLTNGAYCRRRKILLAIHDMKEELEAPSALQSKTLAKLELLHLRPVPQVTFYQDVATAILRMEVVIRADAMQALAKSKFCLNPSVPGAAGRLAPTLGQMPRQRRWTTSWSMSKLGTIGYGLTAVACCAGAITFLSNGYVGELHTGASAPRAANGVEMPTDTMWRAGNLQWRARDCILSSNDDAGKQIDGNACAFETSPAYNQRKLIVIGNSFSAAEFVMYSALTEAGLGAVLAASSGSAPPVREIPHQSSWATSVEANNDARPALLSEVKTQ
jgi:hypothetical protein